VRERGEQLAHLIDDVGARVGREVAGMGDTKPGGEETVAADSEAQGEDAHEIRGVEEEPPPDPAQEQEEDRGDGHNGDQDREREVVGEVGEPDQPVEHRAVGGPPAAHEPQHRHDRGVHQDEPKEVRVAAPEDHLEGGPAEDGEPHEGHLERAGQEEAAGEVGHR
jgi:hypothetical protein